MVNRNVPTFETWHGRHDYDWMLKVTSDRKCVEIEPCVIRYMSGKNLSLDPQYRIEDYNMVTEELYKQGNHKAIKQLTATMGRYFYKYGDYHRARVYFFFSKWTPKNIGYFFTSFCPALATWIVRKFHVFGCIIL
jgi:hypothetical protein